MGTLIKHSIAYYISSHGYGHGVRSCEIIRSLHKACPQFNLHIVSELPRSFLVNRIGSMPHALRAKSFDVGMVQLDSIRVDVNATLERVERLYSNRRAIVLHEAAFLRRNGISLAVVDIPALPLEAAAFIGIPRIAIGNFGWDWIYSGFVPQDSRWKSIVDYFRKAYGKADLLLRLPFCEKMQAFPNIEDIPLVASPGICRRSEIKALTGCDPAKKWILLSFTTLNWSADALERVEQIGEYEFLTVRPLEWRRKNIHPLDREQVCFSDIIASVDAVVSKPGFGILSDCIVNHKPLIYADRSDFLEYSILVGAIRKYLQHLHIPSAKLYRGELRDSLRHIWNRPDPGCPFQHDGADIAARRIAEFAGLAQAQRLEARPNLCDW